MKTAMDPEMEKATGRVTAKSNENGTSCIKNIWSPMGNVNVQQPPHSRRLFDFFSAKKTAPN